MLTQDERIERILEDFPEIPQSEEDKTKALIAWRPETVEGKLGRLMVIEARNRAATYGDFRIQPGDTDKHREARGVLLLQLLARCSQDLPLFVETFAWSPDAKGQFGGDTVRDWCRPLVDLGLIPGGAVPIVLFRIQRRALEEFQRALDRPGGADIALLKSRQVALTTLIGGWAFLWAWFFRDGFTAAVTSYDEDQIEKGGKGQREADSLFGRYRLFLDYMMTCVPALKFNQHIYQHRVTGCKEPEK